MSKIIISPSKYVQGKRELSKFGVHARSLGKKFLIIASPNGIKRTKTTLEKSCKNFNIQLIFEPFNGECCKEEIDRLCSYVESNNCDVVVGIGGGKIFDTAKAVAYYKNTPVVIAPTVASTDAPCSALSVIYTKEGTFSEYLLLPKNPELVLVDTSMVAKAPARLLVAGMGNALATYFEARACKNSNSDTLAGGKGTNSAFTLAKLCYETLLRDGLKAKLAVEIKFPLKL